MTRLHTSAITVKVFYFYDGLLSWQELCRELHGKIDVVDEARYDIEVKVAKTDNEVKPFESEMNSKYYLSCVGFQLFPGIGQIQSLTRMVTELKGIKRPNLKRVKKTADNMLGAYNDPSKLMKADFKVNLKTVKKEDEKVSSTFCREHTEDLKKYAEEVCIF